MAASAGFFIHGRLSFARHGARDRPAGRGVRFVAISLLSLGLNSLFVWALRGPMRLPPLWPIIPMLCVHPTRHLLAPSAMGISVSQMRLPRL